MQLLQIEWCVSCFVNVVSCVLCMLAHVFCECSYVSPIFWMLSKCAMTFWMTHYVSLTMPIIGHLVHPKWQLSWLSKVTPFNSVILIMSQKTYALTIQNDSSIQSLLSHLKWLRSHHMSINNLFKWHTLISLICSHLDHVPNDQYQHTQRATCHSFITWLN